VFWTLEDANKPNASTNTEFSIDSATEYPEYESVLKYGIPVSMMFGLNARTKKAICALEWQYVLAISTLKAATTTAC
jgi:hypothetical protein